MILAGCLPGAKTATTPATTPTPIDQALARIAALEGAVSNINSRIATLNPGEAVAQLRADLDVAVAANQALKTQIAALNDQITSLIVRIVVLETAKTQETTGAVDPEDAVSIDITTVGVYLPKGATTLECPIKLRLTNELAVALEEIELTLYFKGGSSSLELSSANLTGEIDWWPSGAQSATSLAFVSWDDIDLGANSRESYNLVLTMTFSTPIENDVRWSVKAYCEDYEVAR